MATPNRAALLAKTHKVLKQHYTPVAPDRHRTLMEHLLYACCLENASHETADKVYSQLRSSFIDWNEVRVSSVTELSEAMRALPDSVSAASNLKRILHNVFESIYSFDLESIKKKNLGEGIKKLEKTEGTNSFIVAYAVQAGLGGHSIPLDRGALEVLFVLGVANDQEAKSGQVAGLERAIPKNKGAEFASLLHQLGAHYLANTFSSDVRKTLLAINPEAKDRFPTKKAPKKEEPAPAKPAAKKEPAAVKPPHLDGKKESPDKKKPADKPREKHAEKAAEKITEKHVERPAAKKHPPAAKAKPKPAAAAHKKSSTKQLTKRKPR